MRRAIAAARGMLGRTWPNPAVGCVIAKDDVILAEAVTAPGGRPHAEEQALTLAGGKARGATVYVTLEPCGERTSGSASCSARLEDAGVARVVIAADNPDPLSAGRGVARLRAAGVPLVYRCYDHLVHGFTATKRIGNAVVRNRAKRRLREAARLLLPLHGVVGRDYVFVARGGTATRPWARLLDDVKSALISLAPD